jgi:hypothetical protein
MRSSIGFTACWLPVSQNPQNCGGAVVQHMPDWLDRLLKQRL